MAGYQLKITIEYTKPPVWRRIIVPDGITFEDLHKVIQAAFGWEEMHLHDFSFSDPEKSSISPEEAMDSFFSDDLDETQTYLDDYIKDNSWIRYTYDFGDEWRHKIVLEKELPDYKERYAQIIKYKGNNFAEDSGGVWGGDIVSDIFDMEAVNSSLKQLVFKKAASGKRKTKKKEKNQAAELEKESFPDMLPENFLMAMNEIVQQEKDQLDDNTIKLWEKTLEDFKTLIDMSGSIIGGRRSLLGTKIEYTALLFYEEEELPFAAKIKINKKISKRSQKEILMDLQKDELMENMQALGIYFAKSWKKEKLAETMAKNLQEHSDYLYYLLDKQEFSDFLKFFHAPQGSYKGRISAMALKNLVWWGYMDITYHEKENRITVLMPKETEELFRKLEETNWRKKCGNIEKTADEMHRLMQYYGCIEVEKFYLKYTQALRPIDKEDFYKYVYFGLDAHDLLWAVIYQNIDYIYLKDLDMTTVMECRNMVQDLDYPDMTKLDVERWKKGLGIVYPEWMELAQHLYEWYGLSQEDMEEIIRTDLYSALLEGGSLEELVEILADWISIETLEEWIWIWKHLQKIFLRTRISGLKGYTREEVAKKQGVNPFTLAVGLKEEEKGIDASMHLYKMPLEYQNRLSEIIEKSQDSPGEAAKDLENLMMRYNKKHYESRVLLAEFYHLDGQSVRAKKELEEIFEDNQEDEDLEELLDIWENEARKIAIAELSQKKEKKIGRNELCPCGSGKKYKFCCGKNK